MLDLDSLKIEPDRLVKRRHELQQEERELICGNYQVLLDESKHLASIYDEIIDLQGILQKASLQADQLAHSLPIPSNDASVGEYIACLPAIANILSMPQRVQRLIEEDSLEEALRLASSTVKSPHGKRVANKLDPLIKKITDTLLNRLAQSSFDQTVSIVNALRTNVDSLNDLRYAFLKIRRKQLKVQDGEILSFIFDTVAQYKAVFGSDYLLRSWLINNVLHDWSESSSQTLSKLGINVSPYLLQRKLDQTPLPALPQNCELADIKKAFEDLKTFCPLSAYNEVFEHFKSTVKDKRQMSYVRSCMEKLFPREKLQKFLLLPQSE